MFEQNDIIENVENILIFPNKEDKKFTAIIIAILESKERILIWSNSVSPVTIMELTTNDIYQPYLPTEHTIYRSRQVRLINDIMSNEEGEFFHIINLSNPKPRNVSKQEIEKLFGVKVNG